MAQQVGMCLAAFLLCSGLSASVQAAEAPADHVVFAPDDWPVHVTYFKSGQGKESPVVVLLAPANGEANGVTRRIWTDLAKHLQRNGYAVVSVDLRKHGDSVPEQAGSSKSSRRVRTSDYRAMVMGDLEAVKAFLLERHEDEELNIRKLAVVSCEGSAMVGAAFAYNDWSKPPYPDAPTLAARTPRGQDVRALVMFSPRKTRGINPSEVLKPLANPQAGIAFRIYHSSQDKAEQEYAEKLFRFVDLKGEEYDQLRSIESAPASGEDFLRGRMLPDVQQDLSQFLDTNLKDLPSPWKTRRSRLDN